MAILLKSYCLISWSVKWVHLFWPYKVAGRVVFLKTLLSTEPGTIDKWNCFTMKWTQTLPWFHKCHLYLSGLRWVIWSLWTTCTKLRWCHHSQNVAGKSDTTSGWIISIMTIIAAVINTGIMFSTCHCLNANINKLFVCTFSGVFVCGARITT